MKIHSKLKSRKLFVTLWAMAMLTWALISNTQTVWFAGVAPILAAIIAVYVGIQGYLDKNKKDE